MQKTKFLKCLAEENLEFYFPILTLVVCVLSFTGCAAVSRETRPIKKETESGIYHRVEKGQTLWRISKIYDVDLDELIKVNKIIDVSNIEVNRLIFIPNRQNMQNFPKNYAEEDFLWPIKGKVVSSFGQINNNTINKGIDIAPVRTKEVVASRSGKIVFLRHNFNGAGTTLIIDHGERLFSVYESNFNVLSNVGDIVQRGSVIAKFIPLTYTKNQYLHFEIRKGYTAQNPYFYLSR